MSNYQTFPNHVGSSDSLSKLYALAMPPLAGKSFLDVGCNEGFFCGYAFFNGASKVLGIDIDNEFIQKAKHCFPFAEFAAQDWNHLPGNDKYDVILCASALHYAEDQSALIDKLVDLLEPDGTLILEVGIAPGPGSKWIEVKRSIDSRKFPTKDAMHDALEKHAYKYIGDSVKQAGDPVPRKVYHVSRRKPYAVLLMNDSGSGKTSLARTLFKGVQTISGDAIVRDVNSGAEQVSQYFQDRLNEVTNQHDPVLLLSHLFSCNGWQEYLSIIIRQARQNDFVYDGFIPKDYHDVTKSFFESMGYFTVTMDWTFDNSDKGKKARITTEAKKYSMFLSSYMRTAEK